MIVLPNGHTLSIKTPVELRQDWTQLLIDAEAAFADKGLAFDFRCKKCMAAGDKEGQFCEGSVNDDCTAFTIECACSTRVGRGTFTAPTPPRPTLARERNDEKRQETITRDDMAIIENAKTVLNRLDILAFVRCLRCRIQATDDIVRCMDRGNEFVMECECTKRICKGTDAPVLTH